MSFRRCFDLTLPLSPDILRYPGDPAPRITTVASIGPGSALRVSEIQLNCHVGTHVDAPAHFVADGQRLDDLALERFHGDAVVIEIAGSAPITPADLEPIAGLRDRHVLLKTGNAVRLRQAKFDPAYRTLSVEAALWLATRTPRSVGFDYYSLDRASATDFPAHVALARAGIPVFLPLHLDTVTPGEYWFVGTPLPLVGVEASPVRALLFA